MDRTMGLGPTEHWDSQSIASVVLLILGTNRMDGTMGLGPAKHWDSHSIVLLILGQIGWTGLWD